MSRRVFTVNARRSYRQSADRKAPLFDQVAQMTVVLAGHNRAVVPRSRNAVASVRHRIKWPLPMVRDASARNTADEAKVKRFTCGPVNLDVRRKTGFAGGPTSNRSQEPAVNRLCVYDAGLIEGRRLAVQF